MTYTYHVKYKEHRTGEVKGVDVVASNKDLAYFGAVYDIIPAKDGRMPYSAWVASVTYNNGNYRVFNTWEGKPT